MEKWMTLKQMNWNTETDNEWKTEISWEYTNLWCKCNGLYMNKYEIWMHNEMKLVGKAVHCVSPDVVV